MHFVHKYDKVTRDAEGKWRTTVVVHEDSRKRMPLRYVGSGNIVFDKKPDPKALVAAAKEEAKRHIDSYGG